MITDILSEAADEIRRWIEECPLIFSGYEENINDLLTRMDKLRSRLDAMPPGVHTDQH